MLCILYIYSDKIRDIFKETKKQIYQCECQNSTSNIQLSNTVNARLGVWNCLKFNLYILFNKNH